MRSQQPSQRTWIVGVGASAGGLEALGRFFRAIPEELDAAFIVVQHLSPEHKSMMAELLAKQTARPVREAIDGELIAAGCVLLAPPHANIVAENGRLKFRARAALPTPNLSVNVLFDSLAASCGPRAVGIVLSGTGSDGRSGVERIKQAGGLVFVQRPDTARFDGMPSAALSSGIADVSLPPEEMGAELLRLQEHGVEEPSSVPTDAVAALLAKLHRASGLDFGEYKPATVARRIARRIALRGARDIEHYTELVESDPQEAEKLSSEILINVTSFFRDPEVFQELSARWLPALAERAAGEPLRIWVAGCSTGQEAYSLAMLFEELTPGSPFRIFATDMDAAALEAAALGFFREAELANVSDERRARFFRPTRDGWEVTRELRRHVLFAAHNVGADPPFTRLDMVTCRNLLIYLEPDLQRRVLASFAFGLKPGGLLLLGRSESVATTDGQFRLLTPRDKLFARLDGPRVGLAHLQRQADTEQPGRRSTDLERVIDAATRMLLDRSVPASVLVNEQLELVRVFGNAERLLVLPTGSPTLSLPAMLPAALVSITTLAAHRALSSGQDAVFPVFEGLPADVAAVHAQPVVVSGPRYLLITFERRLAGAPSGEILPLPDEAARQLDELRREVAIVRESLQATIEELETSNEELQATNEELLAANEELQATNEELQSVNEELTTVNAEHHARIAELVQLNADLDNLLDTGTVFLDEHLRIRRFTSAATALFPLLDHDVGRPFADIRSGVGATGVVEDLRTAHATQTRLERTLLTSEGRAFLVRMGPYHSTEHGGMVLTFVDVTDLRAMEAERTHLQGVIDALAEHVAVLDNAGVIRSVNRAWQEFARENGGIPERCGTGASYLDACQSSPETLAAIQAVLEGTATHSSIEYPCHSPQETRWFVMHVTRLPAGNGAVVSHVDTTAKHRLAHGSEALAPARSASAEEPAAP